MLYSIIVSLLWGGVTGYYANKKGQNLILWSAAGAFLGIFGLLLCIGYCSYAQKKQENKYIK